MTRPDLRIIRLVIGFLTGLLLWLIWQTSAITGLGTESVNYEKFLAELPPGWMDFFRPWTHEEFVRFFNVPFSLGQWWTFGKDPATDSQMVHTWIGFLPISCLFGVLFSILRPMPRFAAWVLSLLAVGSIIFYCFQNFHYLLPLSQPIIVLSCFYLCGTVIHLETEKIERNRSLAIDLQEEAEQERKRIAKDLHDESLQSMSRIIRIIDKLSDEIPDNPVPKEVRTKLEACIAGTRNIINDLHPAQLEEFGLAASLEQLIEEFKKSAKVKVKYQDASNEIRLPGFFELCIYRIAQEAMNNIEKHANASEVSISLENTEKQLCLKISDNGKGVDTVQKKTGSFGLRNIIDRTKLMNGEVEWKRPEEFASGTSLVLKVPLLPMNKKGKE